eukprot:gene12008-330_t
MRLEASVWHAGMASGVCQVLVEHPIDTVKTRLQTQTLGFSMFAAGAAAGLCNSTISCPVDWIKSVAQGMIPVGLCALLIPKVAHGQDVQATPFTGLAPMACRDTLGYGVLFTAFAYLTQTGLPSPVAGGLSGLAFYMAVLPLDRVKVIMQTQPASVGNQAFVSSLACLRSVCTLEGLAGLYKGSGPTLLKTFLGQAVALSTFKALTAAL